MPSPLRIEDLPPAGEPFEVLIDDYGFTGEGFVRLQDGWLSVRGVMPGERARVTLEPQQRGGRRRFARLLELLSTHPERRDPQCPQAEVCRGCQIRHLSLRAEADYKERAILEVLEKFTEFPADTLPPVELIAPTDMARADGWRVRTSLSYRRLDPHHYELGLVSPALSHLLPMAHCPALSEPARRLVQQLVTALDQLAARGELPEDGRENPEAKALLGVRLAAPAHGRGFIEIKQSPHAEIGGAIFSLIEALDERLPRHVSVFVDRGDSGYDRLRGPERLRLSLSELTLEIDPRDWFHATLEPAEVLYERVQQWLDWRPEQRFLDVGCGVGTLSLMAARSGLHALGIDARLTSIQSAELNAERLELSDRAQFLAGSWEAAMRKLVVQQRRFDLATINPMREPLGERALGYFNALGAERLVYLGPSPAATARDLELLRQRGWRLDALGAAMLHPATYHVMLVAACSRT